MKTPILVGIVLFVVIVAAVIVGPQFIAGGRSAAEADALAQADLAARQLYRVSPRLLQLRVAANPGALEDNQFLAAAAEAAQAQLDELSQSANRRVRNVSTRLEREDVPPPNVDVPRLDAQSALAGYRELVGANESLLKAAQTAAQQSARDARTAVGTSQVLGMTSYVQALGKFVESEQLRLQQDELQAELMVLADQWLAARASADRYKGRDVTPILEQLRADREELHEMLTDAETTASQLATAVNERRNNLQQITRQMQQVQQDLVELERAGFEAGNDASFEAYRNQYLDLRRQLADLEAREQERRHGGRPGASLSGPDLATADVVGGDEPVLGLEELERRLELAEEKAKRLSNGQKSLDNHIEYVVSAGRQASQQQDTQTARQSELLNRQRELVTRIADVAIDAQEREDAALRDARSAAQAFGQSQQAVRSYLNDLRQVQSERDPERKNPRVRAVLGDQYLAQYGRAAQANAQLLVAQIHSQRVRSVGSLLDDMGMLEQIHADTLDFDPNSFTQTYDEAQTQALAALDDARNLYENVRGGLPSGTQWVPLGGLAAAQFMTGLVSPEGMTTWADQALQTINTAVENRTASPYLKPYVRFRNLFGAPTPVDPGAETPEVEEGGEGFFE